MNRIIINLKCGESVVLTDQDKMPKDQLLETLSSLFSINSVSILKTKTTSVIIRPSDISSITVEDNKSVEKIEEIPSTPQEPHEEESEQPIDIITDID